MKYRSGVGWDSVHIIYLWYHLIQYRPTAVLFHTHHSFSLIEQTKTTCKWLTGIVSQVLLMNCSLSVDWLYVSMILQLLRAPGTTYGIQWYALKVAKKKINQSLYQVKSNGVARILIMPKQYETLQHWNTWMLHNIFVHSLCIAPQIERSTTTLAFWYTLQQEYWVVRYSPRIIPGLLKLLWHVLYMPGLGKPDPPPPSKSWHCTEWDEMGQ